MTMDTDEKPVASQGDRGFKGALCGFEGVLSNPCATIDELWQKKQSSKAEASGQVKSFGVKKFFAEFVEAHGAKIPTLHPKTASDLKPGGLVKVVAMVQDMQEPEFFYA